MVGYLALIGVIRNAYNILIRQTEEKSLFSIYREDNSIQISVCNVYQRIGVEGIQYWYLV